MPPENQTSKPRHHKRQGNASLPFVVLGCCLAVVLSHLTLLHLPYFWDEGGYYVPAALDFFRTGTLIPAFTNAHPPLPNVVLGSLWHIFGFHILVTRITACVFAGVALAAVYQLGARLLSPLAGVAVAALTAIFPIWFAQSSLAHADIFAASFTLAALALYLPSGELIGRNGEIFSTNRRCTLVCLLFCASVLAKETAVIQPATLGILEAVLAFRARSQKPAMRSHRAWAVVLLIPIPVLSTWFLYHFLKTGFVFGNPEFLRYNATANFTASHVFYALRIRFVHLFWQREIWVPLVLAIATLVLPMRPESASRQFIFGLPRGVLLRIGCLLLANLLGFSVLGGALLTRYLLPMYPLLLLVCVAVWRTHWRGWPWLAAITAGAFLCAIWLNPWTFFAPEDNLTYRNMIVVQQHAIDYLNAHDPQATVLTAWPVSADLFRPELGYTQHPFHVFQIENFTPDQLEKAAEQPGRFDTAVVFTTHYLSPSFRRSLRQHPNSWRGRRYSGDLDLLPADIARRLGGTVAWQQDIDGEWAAVLRFPRSYDATRQPYPLPGATLPGAAPERESAFTSSTPSSPAP